MEQMKINPNAVVTVSDLPAAASILQPVVFTEGDTYCCLLGPDPEAGIFGCGNTPDDAVEDWEDSLRHRVNRAHPDDEVAQEIIKKLQGMKVQKDEFVNSEVQRFYDQFIPGKS